MDTKIFDNSKTDSMSSCSWNDSKILTIAFFVFQIIVQWIHH